MHLTEDVYSTLLLLRPWDIDIPKVRVGRERDGGYVMADLFHVSDTLISIGINRETSFDADMSRKGKRIVQYDHTIDAPPEEYPDTTWHKLGLGPRDEPDKAMVSLETIVSKAGLTKNRGILKMDIEGAEWDVLKSVSPEF